MFLAAKYGRKKYREYKTQKQLQHGTHNRRHPDTENAENVVVDPRSPASSTPSSQPAEPDSHSNLLTPEEKAENKRKSVYRWKVVLGLFAPLLLQALDTTIVASALPTIAAKFGESVTYA